MKKKIVTVLLAGVLIFGTIATPVSAAPSVNDLKKNKASAQSEVENLQSQLNDLISKMNDLETQLIEKGQEKTQAEADLKDAEAKEKQQYEDMKLRIKYMYEEGDNSALGRIAESGDIADVLSQAEYVEKVHSYDRNMLKEYEETVEKVKTLKATIDDDINKIQSLEGEYQSQSEELNATISAKSDEIKNLDSMIQEAARAAVEAQKAEAAKKAETAKKTQTASANTNSGSTSNSGGSSNNSNSGTTNNDNNSYVTPSAPSAPSASVDGGSVVSRAYSQLGAAYVWGACSPGAFDCSGFVSYCLTGSYTRLGTTYTFLGWQQVSDPQPGDVCVNADHCGIYIGGGQMIHAATEGVGVIVGPVQGGMIYVRY